jgi:hypothetical protein
MCLDQRAMRSYAAFKGWETRRAAKLSQPEQPPLLWGGVRLPAGSASDESPSDASTRSRSRSPYRDPSDFSDTADSA